MKNTKKILPLILIILIITFVSFQGIKIFNQNKNKSNTKVLEVSSKYVNMYKLILEHLMDVDTALQHDMEYISLDINSFPNLTEKEQKDLLTFMEKYHNIVKPNSFKELEEQGLFHQEEFYLDGILISIEEIKFISENKVDATIVKYRSGDGAIFLNYKMEYNGKNWTMDAFLRGIS